MSSIAPMLLAALGISFLIFIHELGHFLAARLFGVRVDVFSIGFGPRLAGFKRGDTDYRLSAVPLGGYVKMAGEYGDAPTDAPPRPDDLLAKPAWQRAIVFSAGVIVNFAFAFVAFPLAFSIGVPFIAPVVGGVEPGNAAWAANLQPGDEILSVNGARVHQFNDVTQGVALGDRERTTLRIRRAGTEMEVSLRPERNEEAGTWEIGILPPADTELHVAPGSAAQLAGLLDGDRLVAIDGESVASTQGGALGLLAQGIDAGGSMRVEFERDGVRSEAVVVPVPAEPTGQRLLGMQPLATRVAGLRGPAADPLQPLRDEDVVLSVADAPVTGPDGIRTALEAAPPGDVPLVVRRAGRLQTLLLPAAMRAAVAGDDVAFGYDRQSTAITLIPGSALAAAGVKDGDTIVALDGVDVSSYEELQERVQGGKSPFEVRWRDAEGGLHTASVETRELPLMDHGLHVQYLRVLYREDAMGAISAGIDTSLNLLRTTWLMFAKLITGDVGAKNLGGIVMISRVSYEYAEQGFSELLFFLGLLSINLGFINILPIPVLDGGQILFLIFERIRGRRLSERFLNSMQMAGLLAIVALVVFVTFNDIMRLIR